MDAGKEAMTRQETPWWRSLSMRLLLLTVFFVMISEVLIFAPSVGRFRLTYMEEKLGAAHLALLAVEATPDGMVDEDLQKRLLDHAGTLGMTVYRPERARYSLYPNQNLTVAEEFDIRERRFFPLIAQAFSALVRTEPRVIGVMGRSPREPDAVVDVLIEEQPMIAEMRDYGLRILGLSLLISLLTAIPVYLTLHWLFVRPLKKLSDNMQAFRDDPEDPSRILVPSRRRDEVGVAERALAEMQARLRDALRQQARLAAVGTAVSKMSHDLKGVLTTAILESDRLEAATGSDPEVRHVTRGIARALDRAIVLCTDTLRFARQGPPPVQARNLPLRPIITEAAQSMGPACTWKDDVSQDQEVWADPDLLLRALENLCRNACEAGATEIGFSVRTEGPMLSLMIADNGPGLPPKAMENLFVPFSGSARAGGSGLGLPIARDLIKAQGGALELLENGPEGAVFWMSVPLPRR